MIVFFGVGGFGVIEDDIPQALRAICLSEADLVQAIEWLDNEWHEKEAM